MSSIMCFKCEAADGVEKIVSQLLLETVTKDGVVGLLVLSRKVV